MSRFQSSSIFAVLLVLSPMLAQGGAAQQIDLSGQWVFTVQSPNGTGTREVSIAQHGDSISGSISSSRAAGELTGRVDGDQVTFTAILTMDGAPFPVTYVATVVADQMEGTVDFGDYGKGTFTGRRSNPDRKMTSAAHGVSGSTSGCAGSSNPPPS